MASDNTQQTEATTLAHPASNLPPDEAPLARAIDAYDAVKAFADGVADDTRATQLKGSSICHITAAVLALYSKLYDHDSPMHNSLWQLWAKAGAKYYSSERRGQVKVKMMAQLGIAAPSFDTVADKDSSKYQEELRSYNRRNKLLDRGIDFAGAILLSHPDYMTRDDAQYSVDQAFDFFDQAKGVFILPYQSLLPSDYENKFTGVWLPDGDFRAQIDGDDTLGIAKSPNLRLPLDNRMLRIRRLLKDRDGKIVLPTQGTVQRRDIQASVQQVLVASESKRVVLQSVERTLADGRTETVIEATKINIEPQRAARQPAATSPAASTASKSATAATGTMSDAQIAGKQLPIFAEALVNARKAIDSFVMQGWLEKPLTTWSKEDRDAIERIDTEYSMLTSLYMDVSDYVRNAKEEEGERGDVKPSKPAARKQARK